MAIIWHSVLMKACISVNFLVSVFGFLLCGGTLAQLSSSLPASQPDKEGVSSAAVLSSELNRHLPYTQQMRRSIGASGAWIKPDEYQAKIYFTQSPASIIYTFRFENNRMSWRSEVRHSLLGPKKLATLQGE
ncbi:MAG TPA: hypothetical protein DCR17_00600 [Verrucomicrobiales bacterium]|nr:hypothetical protein [Verrucomicrobiales bacterium]